MYFTWYVWDQKQKINNKTKNNMTFTEKTKFGRIAKIGRCN